MPRKSVSHTDLLAANARLRAAARRPRPIPNRGRSSDTTGSSPHQSSSPPPALGSDVSTRPSSPPGEPEEEEDVVDPAATSKTLDGIKVKARGIYRTCGLFININELLWGGTRAWAQDNIEQQASGEADAEGQRADL